MPTAKEVGPSKADGRDHEYMSQLIVLHSSSIRTNAIWSKLWLSANQFSIKVC